MIKQYVTDLEHSIKLKKLGVKQESEWYWVVWFDGDKYLRHDWEAMEHKRQHGKNAKIYAAFSVGELGEMLKHHLCYTHYFSEGKQKWICYIIGIVNAPGIFAKTEANARAFMLEYLIKNKLIKMEV